MAIPDSPNWSPLTDVKAYPQPGFVKPPLLPGQIQAIALGPVELNQSGGKLSSRYWNVTQEGGQVVILGSQL